MMAYGSCSGHHRPAVRSAYGPAKGACRAWKCALALPMRLRETGGCRGLQGQKRTHAELRMRPARSDQQKSETSRSKHSRWPSAKHAALSHLVQDESAVLKPSGDQLRSLRGARHHSLRRMGRELRVLRGVGEVFRIRFDALYRPRGWREVLFARELPLGDGSGTSSQSRWEVRQTSLIRSCVRMKRGVLA